MERIGKLLVVVTFLVGMSCSNSIDTFNGTITKVNTYSSQRIKIVSTKVELEDYIDMNSLAVYDSLSFLLSWRDPRGYYCINNTETGQYLGNYIQNGGGSNECYGVLPIYQFFQSTNGISTLLYAPNNEELVVWNITESLHKGHTVFDSTINFKNKYASPIDRYFYLDENKLLVQTPTCSKQDFGINARLGGLDIIDLKSDTVMRSYVLFNEEINTKNPNFTTEDFFLFLTALKPDCSKVAMGMSYIPQLNILDLNSGELKGIIFDKSNGFGELMNNPIDKKWCVTSIQCDDEYIYCLYYGKILTNNPIDGGNEIFVFDWDGNLIRVLELDSYVTRVWLNSSKRTIYAISQTKEYLYTYKLP